MKIAAAAYPLDFHADFAAYEAKLTRWVEDAAAQGADLLVFPEYGAMELASLGGAEVAADLELALVEVARWRDEVDALHLRLAAAYGLHILGASGPVYPTAGARPVNRATLYAPTGILGHQDKQIMTRFERETWFVDPGHGLPVFDTALGRIGILICYDSEFPLLARRLTGSPDQAAPMSSSMPKGATPSPPLKTISTPSASRPIFSPPGRDGRRCEGWGRSAPIRSCSTSAMGTC